MVIDNVICSFSSSFPSNEKKMLWSCKLNIPEVWQTFKSYMQLLGYLENDANTNNLKTLQLKKFKTTVLHVLSNKSYFPLREY